MIAEAPSGGQSQARSISQARPRLAVHVDAVKARLDAGGHGESQGIAVGGGRLQGQGGARLALQAGRAGIPEVQALAQHPQPAAWAGHLPAVPLHPPWVGGVDPCRRGRRAVRDDAAGHHAGLPLRRHDELDGTIAGLQNGDTDPRPGSGRRGRGRGGTVLQPRHLDDGLFREAAALQKDRLVRADGIRRPEDPRLGPRIQSPCGADRSRPPHPEVPGPESSAVHLSRPRQSIARSCAVEDMTFKELFHSFSIPLPSGRGRVGAIDRPAGGYFRRCSAHQAVQNARASSKRTTRIRSTSKMKSRADPTERSSMASMRVDPLRQ